MRNRVEMDCSADPEAVRQARAFAAATLASWNLDPLVDLAQLLVSEVATNAVIHARTAFRLSMMAQPPMLRMEVYDGSAAEPRMGMPDGVSTTGRGLLLLDALSSGWGWELSGAGKIVWFMLPFPDGGR